jgi:hypothetical protein
MRSHCSQEALADQVAFHHTLQDPLASAKGPAGALQSAVLPDMLPSRHLPVEGAENEGTRPLVGNASAAKIQSTSGVAPILQIPISLHKSSQ